MSELVMIKTTDHHDIQSRGLPLEALIGISIDGEKTATEYGYRVNGDETEEVLNGADSVIEAIVSFFHETQVRKPESRLSYNCHSFVSYSLGTQATVQHVNTSNFELSNTEVLPSRLEPAVPYALVRQNGEHNHSTIGINRPEYSVGVLGTNNPLVICANGLLRYLYRADRINKIVDIVTKETN